jgi:hypothetical protein
VKAGAALAVLGCLLAPAARAADADWRYELSGQQEWQQWRETGRDGRRVVTEDGRLAGLAATLAWAPRDSATASLRLGALWGGRDYRGLSNQGNELSTRSDLGHVFVRAEGGWALQPLAGAWQWQPLVAAELWQWRRRLQDAGNARGYPERYRQGLLLLGLQVGDPDGVLLRLEAGSGPAGSNRVELPGRDAAALPLGRASSGRLGLGGAMPLDWRWELTAERLTLAAGDERPITLQGVPLQSARQPRTELRRLQFQLSWRGWP